MRSQFVVGARARSMHTYKDAKEAFVSDTTGSSLSTVLRVSSITVVSKPIRAYHLHSVPSGFLRPISRYISTQVILPAIDSFGFAHTSGAHSIVDMVTCHYDRPCCLRIFWTPPRHFRGSVVGTTCERCNTSTSFPHNIPGKHDARNRHLHIGR